jgi:hypothetical protein
MGEKCKIFPACFNFTFPNFILTYCITNLSHNFILVAFTPKFLFACSYNDQIWIKCSCFMKS